MNIYKDIAKRTGGDIYIGVVGPVRTGKSTFIKRFMQQLVLPNISDQYKKERAIDELPQSAEGRTIMTTEPKFIPENAVKINLSGEASLNVKMIDCVGYVVEGSNGYLEEGGERMVSTPWSEESIPFVKAAEIGTHKVIKDHSTIGLVVTTDGSISDIPRENYIEAENRVISELKEINKPFVILLNSSMPDREETKEIARELENKHCVPVVCVNCLSLTGNEINSIIESILMEFPLKEIKIDFPEWVDCLEDTHWLNKSLTNTVRDNLKGVEKLRQVSFAAEGMGENENISLCNVDNIDLGSGEVHITVNTKDHLFYKILGETSGFEISGREDLVKLISNLSFVKKEYDKISWALEEVKQKGYGIVSPSIDELKLEEPEIVKQGGRFGVRLKASAPSIHMIRADIETEVNPLVGTEKQSEELVKYLLDEFDSDKSKIWESNIFGKSLHELVNEGLHNKLYNMPDDARFKLQETLQKIINEGSGGLICIIL